MTFIDFTGTNPAERFFDRDGSGNGGGRDGNSSDANSGFSGRTDRSGNARGNGGPAGDNRRAGGSRNKNRGSSEDNGEPNQKSSRWGNVSPKPEENWDNSKKKSANKNRNDSSGPNESQTENAATEDNSPIKSCEFLNDPSNPDAMPVRPIRLPKEQVTTTPTKTNDSNDGETTITKDAVSDITNSNIDRAVKATNENASDTNSSYEAPKPPRQKKEVNTTPLYDEPSSYSHQPQQETQSSVTAVATVSTTAAPKASENSLEPIAPPSTNKTNNINDSSSIEKSIPVTPSAAAVPLSADSTSQSNEHTDCVISEPTTATE